MRVRNLIYNSRRLPPILHKPVRLLALRNYTNLGDNSLTIVGSSAVSLLLCPVFHPSENCYNTNTSTEIIEN